MKIKIEEKSIINILSFALLFAVGFALFVLISGLSSPILDLFNFRQTQTALTTYWLVRGGAWLAYETPVLGAPWAIPFEFPVYQLVVAGLASIGVPLDAAGRIINFAFFLATLWPLWLLFRALKLSRASYLATAIIFVCSPLYLYWSRTFLIESCALFFAVLWLSMLARYLSSGGWLSIVVATASGCLAVLAKSTTFPAFVLVGGLGAMWVLVGRLRAGQPFARVVKGALPLAICVAVPFAIGFWWVNYSDQIKSLNEFGRSLTSANLSRWNFGAIDQRFSEKLWVTILVGRVLPDIFGNLYSFVVVIAISSLFLRKFLIIQIASIVGFLFPIFVFTNLHIVHNYYQVSNAIFLIAAIGIGIGAIFSSGYRFPALVALLIVISSQIYYFNKTYLQTVIASHAENRALRIALIAKNFTQPGQSLIIFGEDWSSAVAYYAERKSLTVPGWAPGTLVAKVLSNPQSFLGDRPLGGIIDCAGDPSQYGAASSSVQAFIANRDVLGEFGGCKLLSVQRAL